MPVYALGAGTRDSDRQARAEASGRRPRAYPACPVGHTVKGWRACLRLLGAGAAGAGQRYIASYAVSFDLRDFPFDTQAPPPPARAALRRRVSVARLSVR